MDKAAMRGRYVTIKGGVLGLRDVIVDVVLDEPIAEFYGDNYHALSVALAALNEDAEREARQSK